MTILSELWRVSSELMCGNDNYSTSTSVGNANEFHFEKHASYRCIWLRLNLSRARNGTYSMFSILTMERNRCSRCPIFDKVHNVDFWPPMFPQAHDNVLVFRVPVDGWSWFPKTQVVSLHLTTIGPQSRKKWDIFNVSPTFRKVHNNLWSPMFPQAHDSVCFFDYM